MVPFVATLRGVEAEPGCGVAGSYHLARTPIDLSSCDKSTNQSISNYFKVTKSSWCSQRRIETAEKRLDYEGPNIAA